MVAMFSFNTRSLGLFREIQAFPLSLTALCFLQDSIKTYKQRTSPLEDSPQTPFGTLALGKEMCRSGIKDRRY